MTCAECTCCTACCGDVRWCVLAAVFRLLHAIWTHFVWFIILLMNCLYFQCWKSYDILWFWLHTVLCICVPSLRRNNMIATVVRIFYHKAKHRDKSMKDVYLEKVRGQTEFAEVAQDEIDEEQKCECECPDVNCCKFDGAQHFYSCYSGYAGAIEMAFFLYRVRASVAVIKGTIYQKIWLKTNPIDVNGPLFGEEFGNTILQSTSWKKQLWDKSWYFVYVDVAMLWLMVLIAYCRQCRLCCVMGCCRFIMWTVVVIVCDLILMEWPMGIVESRLDGSLCKFAPAINGTM